MGRNATRDISRSDALSSGQLQWLKILHEGLPGAFGAAISTVLRNPVEVSLAGVEQLTYGKFVQELDDPSYFCILKADPLGDRLMLDIELAILYPMLDRLLGGGHADEPPPRRPPTDIELPLAARVVRLFLEHLRQAWQGVLPLRFEVQQVESHPRPLRVVPSDEIVALLSFTLTIGNRHGLLRLCMPCRAIQQIADRMRTAGSEGHPTPDDDCIPGVEVVVTLATTSISASDLQNLRVGDIIVTETATDSPAVVSIDGEPKCRARAGTCEGRKAVVLSEATHARD
jgi:flagellar motor switch protein FliM